MKMDEITSKSLLSKQIFRRVLLLIVLTVLIIFAVFHLDTCFVILQKGIAILSPFLVGIVFAFMLNLLVKLFEERVFRRLDEKNGKVWKKIHRPVCILIALLILFLGLTFVCVMVIPELLNSITTLVNNLPGYFNNFKEMTTDFTKWINELIEQYGITQSQILSWQKELKIDWSGILKGVTDVISGGGKALVSMTMGFTTGVINLLLSLIFAIYMLASKEKLIRNLKRVIFAFLPKKHAQTVVSVGALANKIFAGFVGGQFTEALILGILCYIGMSILRLPYALLVSVIIGVTCLIPVFGAYIGAILGGFIILIVNPMSCLWFIIFIIFLQNFEGNVIYPRVVGNSVGLPGLWVMFSIFVCGDLFGFTGMLIGVPLFSVIYSIIKTVTAKRLQEKEITYEEILQASKSSVLAGDVPVIEEKVHDKRKIDRIENKKGLGKLLNFKKKNVSDSSASDFSDKNDDSCDKIDSENSDNSEK